MKQQNLPLPLVFCCFFTPFLFEGLLVSSKSFNWPCPGDRISSNCHPWATCVLFFFSFWFLKLVRAPGVCCFSSSARVFFSPCFFFTPFFSYKLSPDRRFKHRRISPSFPLWPPFFRLWPNFLFLITDSSYRWFSFRTSIPLVSLHVICLFFSDLLGFLQHRHFFKRQDPPSVFPYPVTPPLFRFQFFLAFVSARPVCFRGATSSTV